MTEALPERIWNEGGCRCRSGASVSPADRQCRTCSRRTRLVVEDMTGTVLEVTGGQFI